MDTSGDRSCHFGCRTTSETGGPRVQDYPLHLLLFVHVHIVVRPLPFTILFTTSPSRLVHTERTNPQSFPDKFHSHKHIIGLTSLVTRYPTRPSFTRSTSLVVHGSETLSTCDPAKFLSFLRSHRPCSGLTVPVPVSGRLVKQLWSVNGNLHPRG